mgnify:CR=1 FL=1
MRRPILALTMGDPAGIGPEIILKAIASGKWDRRARLLIVGDQRIINRTASWLGMTAPAFEFVDDPQDGLYEAKCITLLDMQNASPIDCPPGQLRPESGRAAVEYVNKACDLAMTGKVNAIVTAPVNKAAMHAAGFLFPGQTELLASRTGTQKVTMLLASRKLRVVHISMHTSLREAIERVTFERVIETIRLADQACHSIGLRNPRIGVAGLNPHAGEDGLFGKEEMEIIHPAIKEACRGGLCVTGPWPPDTIFRDAVMGKHDIVVAMYHDQGHIPMKVLAFETGVNVSIGLPIIRTSVDHGTAFDIAGKGVAKIDSLQEAIRVALTMVRVQSFRTKPPP